MYLSIDIWFAQGLEIRVDSDDNTRAFETTSP